MGVIPWPCDQLRSDRKLFAVMAQSRRLRWSVVVGLTALLVALVVVTASSARRGHHRTGASSLPWTAEKRALLGELAILRRPQRSSDLNPEVLRSVILRSLHYDRRLVRRATAATGQHVFLIPIERNRQRSGSAGLVIYGVGGAGCCVTAARSRRRAPGRLVGLPAGC
jgi:hypothetical protein